MTNQVQQVSSNLPLQLQKQSLSAFVETNDQLIIVKTIERSTPIKIISSPSISLEEKTKYENFLLEIVTRWKMNLGLANKSEEQKTTIELALVRDFIIDNYSHLTFEEIELAYILALTDKLDDCEYFGYFSPLFCGKVLNSYIHYRKMQLADAIRRQEKARLLEMEEKQKPTPEKEAELTCEIFKDFHHQATEGKDIQDIFNICWNYLRNQVKSGNKDFLHRWTNPQKADYEEAIAYAKKKIEQQQESIFEKAMAMNDKEAQIKRIARNYCVQQYLKDEKLENIVKKIKPEHFS